MSNQQGSLLLFGENNYHKMMSSKETRLTVKINDLIISEGVSFNIVFKNKVKGGVIFGKDHIQRF